MIVNIRNEKGMVLIVSYLVIAVLLTFSLIFVSRSFNTSRVTQRYNDLTLAFNLAEAGLDRGLGWLRNQPVPPAGVAPINVFINVALGQGTYSVVITPDAGNPASFIDKYTIASTATVRGTSRTLINDVQVDSFARYIYFSNVENFNSTNVWFWDLDALNGRVQTNAHFNIAGRPLFDGAVASADTYIRFYNNGSNINVSGPSNLPFDNPDFRQGIDFGAPRITMPSRALDLRGAAAAGGYNPNGNTTIVLNCDGTMNTTNGGTTVNNRPLPANGAIFVRNGNLTVSGCMNGQLAMGAERDIIINNNIVYADDPRTNPSSDDILGLVAERDIMISSGAPFNMQIDATVMALDTSFYVQNWASIAAKGTLSLYGGIIQKERGPVGTFNWNTRTKVSGYSKNYRYDNRLLTNPPPFFPTTGDYVSLSWREG